MKDLLFSTLLLISSIAANSQENFSFNDDNFVLEKSILIVGNNSELSFHQNNLYLCFLVGKQFFLSKYDTNLTQLLPNIKLELLENESEISKIGRQCNKIFQNELYIAYVTNDSNLCIGKYDLNGERKDTRRINTGRSAVRDLMFDIYQDTIYVFWTENNGKIQKKKLTSNNLLLAENPKTDFANEIKRIGRLNFLEGNIYLFSSDSLGKNLNANFWGLNFKPLVPNKQRLITGINQNLEIDDVVWDEKNKLWLMGYQEKKSKNSGMGNGFLALFSEYFYLIDTIKISGQNSSHLQIANKNGSIFIALENEKSVKLCKYNFKYKSKRKENGFAIKDEKPLLFSAHIYPEIISDVCYLYLEIMDYGNVAVQLIDSTENVIFKKEFLQMSMGKHSLSMDLSAIPTGAYNYIITNYSAIGELSTVKGQIVIK